MSNDTDACLPAPVKDIVFDLHDSVRRSQVATEQSVFLATFRDLSSKYFDKTAWPSPQSVSSECGGDALFLALYKELTLRHLHSVTRPDVRARIDGWHVYRGLFDFLLAEAPSSESGEDGKEDRGQKQDPFYIVPEWAFDILHEFVYQFQGFCQFRTSTYANALKHASSAAASGEGGSGGKQPPHHVIEALDVLSQNRDAWAVETVLFYLHRLISVGSASNSPPAYKYMALFASVTLSRLECLLGDYRASLAALSYVYSGDVVAVGGELPASAPGAENKTLEEIMMSVFPARLSVSYHAGVSYLMLRRYKDAASVLGSICSYMQRGFKTGQLRNIPGSEQFTKLFERMTALLAILTHVCPTTGIVDDSVLRAVRDKHGHQLSKIEAGEEGYEDLFIFACPKFVSPAVPDYGQATTSAAAAAASSAGGAGGSGGPTGQDAYKLQVGQFMNEMSQQQTLRKLRSYMKLYTSISVGKLAAFNDTNEEEFLPLLLCYKHKMRQLEKKKSSSDDDLDDNDDEDNGGDKNDDEVAPLDGTIGTALDIHYYIVNDMVHVDEAEKQRRFENYFMAQIAQNEEIMQEVDAILTGA
mmetsp:Transcript_39825/g.58182  ORF Transcript_39825/g.58182 Transcript_39825/m.58182 type:complete len:586 (+) Transcript_39825:120-1877(+)